MKYNTAIMVCAGVVLTFGCLAQNPPSSINSNYTGAITFQGEAKAPDGPLSLWYRQPAKVWTESLPVGNGRLGAMVFGGVGQERFQLNEDTLWAGGPYTPD